MLGPAVLAVLLTAAQASSKCSWETCPKWSSDKLNVHLIPHTHDDAGWLKTVDQYYYGSASNVARGGVQYILNTVITELQKDPTRKFSWCETNFFWRWWMNQHDSVRHQVVKLVNDGQLEFIGGGWVQNDEATSHYVATIDQMTLGLDKLNETFGRCAKPKVAWQIDPFGHSREQASLFAQMGYDGLFFARLHYLDQKKRLEDKAAEMIWHGSDDLGKKGDLFTGHFYLAGYYPPPTFCFDALCSDDPFMDDKRLEEYNRDKLVARFIQFAQNQSADYKTNHIMALMGGDFQYTSANHWYINMDKLIEYVNEKQQDGSEVNVIYSTPTCYIKALNEAKQTWSTKSDDFFPYADKVHSYWTGYFTSRPTFKRFIRESNALLQLSKRFDALALLGPSDLGDLLVAQRAVALSQHHDGVTGTAKQVVTYDYEKRLYKGLIECQQVINDAMQTLMPKTKGPSPPTQKLCPLLNVTVCNVSQNNDQFTVTVFNSQARRLSDYIRVPYSNRGVVVTGPSGSAVQAQVVKTFAPASQLGYLKSAPYEVILPVSVPELGFATYFFSKSGANQVTRQNILIEPKETAKVEEKKKTYVDKLIEEYYGRRELMNPRYLRSLRFQTEPHMNQLDQNHSIQNQFLQVEFDAQSGLLSKISLISAGISVPMKQNLYWYEGATYGNKTGKQASGAYIFRPNGTKTTAVGGSQPVQLTKISGPLVNEIRQVFSPWASQVVRLYKDKPYVEIEWTVGPIPIEKKVAKEVISRFDTKIADNKVFFTDANGRQMMNRTRDYQATYTYNNSEPISGNYYPINSRIFIKDSKVQMTVLTDRSQGGSSITDGSVELMLHRRLLEDDHYGVAQALNETGPNKKGLVARGRLWLLISTPQQAAQMHRTLAMDMFYGPTATFAQNTGTPEAYRQKFNSEFSGIARQALPANVNLLSLEQWQGNKILLRLEHFYQKNEDNQMSKPATVNLQNLFTGFEITGIEELTLGANRLVNETSRLEWTPKTEKWTDYQATRHSDEQLTVTLNPFEIRTFRCAVKKT